MAISIVPESNGLVSNSPMDELADLQKHAATARAIFRTVSLAARAQSDGSVVYEDGGAARWHSTVELGCDCLAEVRRIAVESRGPAGQVGWFWPIGLAEALGAALWQVAGHRAGEGLSTEELSIVADSIIEAIDGLLIDIAAGGAH